ncbi:MAG: AAA family ATPase [Acidimicrobiales bacterium]
MTTAPDLRSLADSTEEEARRRLKVIDGRGQQEDEPRVQRQLTARRASQVRQERPTWLWCRWIPAAALSLLVGRQGAGKTTWISHVVAALSAGRNLPDDEERAPIRAGMLSLEEPAGRVVSRLAAAGAELDQVDVLGLVADIDDDGRVVSRMWRLPSDCELLAQRIERSGLGLVVIDGLGYAIGGDSHNYANVGSALAGLAAVAERTGCAIIGLTHPPKGSSDPVTAAIGSTAWTAIPRLVTVLGRHPDDDHRRVVRVAKTNYVEPESGWAWTISDDPEREVGFVTALERCHLDAEDLTAAAATSEERGALAEATEWLADHLAAGPKAAKGVKDAARTDDIAERTLARAKTKLSVRSVKDGNGWVWTLPNQGCQP